MWKSEFPAAQWFLRFDGVEQQEIVYSQLNFLTQHAARQDRMTGTRVTSS
jgi:hypothetical protein